MLQYRDYVSRDRIGERRIRTPRRRTDVPVILPGAGVAELADALDLGSSDENRGGSNPPARTMARPGEGYKSVTTGSVSCK